MLRILIVALPLFLCCFQGRSQGCSDAGFCTMGAMKPDQPFNRKIDLRLRSMEVSFYRGTTTLTPVVYVATADFNFSIGKKTSLQVKVPYQAVSGALGETQGLGDISLCVTRSVHSRENFDINLSVGGKIPSNDANLKENDRPLPMYYQTSLGTYDFITGVSLVNKKWLLATGIQVPLNNNGNEFLWREWEASGEEQTYIQKYAPANELKRGIDVMIRVERNFRYSRFNFSLGLLPIYRVSADKIRDINGNELTPDGAKGLALSAIVTAGYHFNVRSGIKMLGGHKIVQRDHNPDGLTRELVTTISYFYRF